MKASKLRRKELNQMRGSRPFPRAPRLYRVTPTFTTGVQTGVACQRLVDVQWVQGRIFGWRRKAKGRPALCDTALVLVPGKRTLRCPSCYREAKRGRREQLRLNPPTHGFNAITAAVTATAVELARMFRRQAK